ncbi:MAG: DUF1697 domain-containing protein [Candidatus Micrarchaeia archaeon]
MTTYVAFVRGINVGGKTVKMDALRKMFESLGYNDVSTFKASGNVIFDASGSEKANTKKIESGLHKLIGSETRVILRAMDSLKEMVAGEPFKGVKDEPGTRLYVTFLPDGARPKTKERGDGTYSMRAAGSEIYSVLSPAAKTVDIMGMLDKEFGKVVTTRNWNTVTGIAGLDS